jgi:type II secretory pathway component PulM
MEMMKQMWQGLSPKKKKIAIAIGVVVIILILTNL